MISTGFILAVLLTMKLLPELPITRTLQLAQIIASAVPGREPGKHPATRSFQAIRIWTNDPHGGALVTIHNVPAPAQELGLCVTATNWARQAAEA